MQYATAALKNAKQDFVNRFAPLTTFYFDPFLYTPDCHTVATLVVPAVLEHFPLHTHPNQLRDLQWLLTMAWLHEMPEFFAIVNKKITCSSMDAAQKVYWLTMAMLDEPLQHQNVLWEHIGHSAELIAHLRGCLNELRYWIALPADVLGKLIELFVEYPSDTFPVNNAIQRGNDINWLINWLINRLRELGTEQAAQELERLLKLPALSKLQFQIQDVLHQLKLTQRERAFAFLSPAQVAQVLANQAPTSSADLAALALDYLDDIANRIRTDGDDGFNVFWNIKTVKNENTQKMEEVREHRSENLCRDALLTRLDLSFKPLGVRCDREGDYVENNRADIRLTSQRFELPIEVKGEWHEKLKTAAQSQLVQQYAIDPDANGYGIYLVLWFGGKDMPSFKKSDPKPSTPEALQEILEAEFKKEKPQKIFVRVLDVTPPSGSAR